MKYEYLAVESPLEHENPETYGERVRKIMGEKSGIPLVDSSYPNAIIFSKCIDLGLPRDTISMNVDKWIRKLHLEDS